MKYLHTLISCAVLLLAAQTAQALPVIEITERTQELQRLLENANTSNDGTGPVLYTFEWSDCPYCQALYREQSASENGIQVRHILYAVDTKSRNEAADLWSQPSLERYREYMEAKRQAPSSNSTPKLTEGFNQVADLTAQVKDILIANRWGPSMIVSPQSFYAVDGKIYTTAGYDSESYAAMVATIKKAQSHWPALSNHQNPTTGVEFVPTPVAAHTSNNPRGLKISSRGDQLWQALENSPYVSEGTGPAVYSLEVNIDDGNQSMLKEKGQTDHGVEFRRLLVPVSDTSAAETAFVGSSRSLDNYYKIMNRQMKAPAINNNDRVKAINDIQRLVHQSVMPILKANGWKPRFVVPPMLIYKHQEAIYVASKYNHDSFETAVALAKGATLFD